MIITMCELKQNQTGVVINISKNKRIQDLGLTVGTKVKYLFASPMNDPSAYLIRGAVIAIRNKDAKDILVELGDETNG